MKSIFNMLMVLALVLSTQYTYAQIKNAQTAKVMIDGKCEMCKAAIEKAANVNQIAQVNWSKDTREATVTYNAQKTSTDEILKRVALAGYDSEKFLAPDDAYAQLPESCHYTRQYKPALKPVDMQTNDQQGDIPAPTASQKISLQLVLDNYFMLKDALVNADAALAAQNANALVTALKNVNKSTLTAQESSAFNKVAISLTAGSNTIAKAKNITDQRVAFTALAQPVYDLAKATNYGSALYYLHCPMYNDGKGANWLSKEEVVKNPYYGSQMLSCGSVQESILSK